MRKLATLLVALCLGAFIVGCGEKEEPAGGGGTGGTTPPAGGTPAGGESETP